MICRECGAPDDQACRRDCPTITGTRRAAPPPKAEVNAEAVDHPSHYGGADNPYEHVKVAEAMGWGYHIGNATKYLWRAGRKAKADEIEDLKKARWYIERKIQLLEKTP